MIINLFFCYPLHIYHVFFTCNLKRQKSTNWACKNFILELWFGLTIEKYSVKSYSSPSHIGSFKITLVTRLSIGYYIRVTE